MAVSVTWTVNAAGKLHDRVTLPDPVKLVGLRLQFVLLVTRLTTPAKPWRLVTVIVETPDAPALTVTMVGLSLIVKS